MNFRRNWLSFQEEYEDGVIPHAAKAAMELVQKQGHVSSVYLRRQSGASEATITTLQMKLYLTVCGYEKRRNKYREEYGWNLGGFATPEQLYDPLDTCAEEEPEASLECAVQQCARFFPQATEKQITKVLLF